MADIFVCVCGKCEFVDKVVYAVTCLIACFHRNQYQAIHLQIET